MSHHGYSDHKTTASNFAAKASYFEKKLAELHALREKRLELGASAGISQEIIAAEIAAIDAKISEIVKEVEGGEQNTGRDDYYFRSGNDTLASGITGGMADKLGLGSQTKAGDYMALFRGINPRTGELFVPPARAKQIGAAIEKAEKERKRSVAGDRKGDRLTRAQRREAQKGEKSVNLGYSSCVSLQKSLSMVWAVASDEERKEIEQAFMDAARQALKYEEDQGYIGSRVGGLHGVGTEFVKGQGMALIYLHCTSRLAPGARYPDAQLHIHIERPNFVVLPDGTIQTLDARELFARQREFGAVVDVILYEKLKKVRPGLAAAMVFDRAGHGMRLNYQSVSREEVEENSKRSQQIDKEAKKLARDGAAARQAVATNTATFAGKKSVEIGEGLNEHWRETIGVIELHASTAEELKMPSLLEVQQMLFAGNSVIKQSDIDRVAAQLLAGNGGIERLEQVKNEIFRQIGLIKIPGTVDAEGNRSPERFTTQEMIDIESDCLKAVYAGLNDQRWTLPRSAIAAAIEQHQNDKRALQKPGAKPFTLTDEQREAAFKLTGEGQFKFLKGAAGVGKSATIAPIYLAYKAAGLNVMGVAPQNKQATGLTESTGMPAQTVHSLLINHELGMEAERAGKKAKPGQLIPPGTVIICDEAGTLDTYTMQALMRVCHERQAMLIMAGDRNQHGAVPTASFFGTLHDAVGDRVAVIEKISRQTKEFQPTAQALYEEKTDLALDLMDEKDQLLVFAEHVNEADALVADVLADLPSNEKGWAGILVLADTNDQVRALNEKIRDTRIARGELSSDPQDKVTIETVVNGRRELIDVAVGDRLLLRKNASDAENLKVYNGDLGTVLAFERVSREIDGELVDDTKFSVLRDDGKHATVWASEYQAIQHGYAMTSTKSQGMTVWQAYYLPGSTATLQSLYVSYTRGINGAKVYLNESQWADFYKSVEKYRYKETALSLMPERLAAIRANLQNRLPISFTQQSKTVLERIAYTAEPFAMPFLSESKHEQAQAQAHKPHKFDLIPNTADDQEFAAAYGKTVIPLSSFDGSSDQLKGQRIALVETPNAVSQNHKPDFPQPKPQAVSSLEERPHSGNVILNLQSKFKPLRAPAKKTPELKEYQNDRRLSPTDPEQRDPGRATERGTEEPSGRAADRGRGFGVYRLADGADRIQRDPAKHIEHGAGGFRELDPLAAGGGTPRDSLRQVPSRDLAAAGERRAEGVLPDHSDVRGRSTAELRRTGTGKPAASAVKPMRFDKQADARAIQDAKRDVNLIKFAGDLGYKVDEEKTKTKYKRDQIRSNEAAVMTSGASQIDVFKGANGEWAWYDRKAGQGGDAFKLYQHEKPNATFAQAKQAVLDGQPQLSDRDREERDRRADLEAKEKQEKRAEAVRVGTAKAVKDLGFMGRRDTRYLESRGISKEVLAETRWKTDALGRACFPHINADRNICGYEYRGSDALERAKGFTTDTEKGIYIANGRCANPTEIRFCEAGVDTLSAYQLAAPEERQRVLFVGTTGEPGPNAEASIKALVERNNIQKFSLAYDRDEGGDSHTAKREKRLREAFPDAQIRDVREELGMQLGEDPNDLLRRLQAERQQNAERTQQQEQTRSAADNRTQPAQPTRDANQDKPSIERGQAQQPEQTQPEPALQAEPEQTHDHHQDRGMSR